MNYRVVLSPRAQRDLKKLERSVKQRIDGALFELKTNPHVANAQFLKDNRLADFRIRAGDYRILYDVYEEDGVVYVLRIGHRKDIYR